MATKRSASHVHASRQDLVPGEPKRKRQKPDNAGPKSFKKAHPVNELKSQIRSLKRLLERDEKLPATVRVEKERQLQTALQELDETKRAKERSDMIGRYHKIRFFDRQKATKRLKRARKELKAHENSHAEEETRAQLVRRIEDAEVDVNYAQYFPLDQHYVSLFPRKNAAKDEDGDDEDVVDEKNATAERKGDSEMWKQVKRCMLERTLDDLRNGKLMLQRREDGKQVSLESTVKMGRRSSGGEKMAATLDANVKDGGKRVGHLADEDETGADFFE